MKTLFAFLLAIFSTGVFAAPAGNQKFAPGTLLISKIGILMAVPKDSAPQNVSFYAGGSISPTQAKCFKEPIARSDPDGLYRVAALSLAKTWRSHYQELKASYVTCLPPDGDSFQIDGENTSLHSYENRELYAKSKFAAHILDGKGTLTATCVYYSMEVYPQFLVYLLGDTFPCTSPGL